MMTMGQPAFQLFAQQLGLSEDADETAIAAEIPGRSHCRLSRLHSALRLKAEEEAEVARLKDQLRTARVRIIMLEAIGEAGNTLG